MKKSATTVICSAFMAAAMAASAALTPNIVTGPGYVVYDSDTIRLGDKALYVDGSLSEAEAEANPWIFRDMREALSAAADGTEERPMQIFVAPWVYWIDDPDDEAIRVGKDGREPIAMTVRCENLHITGLADDARDVVIASARGQTQGADGNFTMLEFWGDGLTVKNLTMGNYCNVDLDYPLKPELSRQKRSGAITQAHVAYCHGDKIYAENVRFISRLNMNPLSGGRRTLFNRCHMEMTDDALAPTGVYLHCTLDYYGARPFWATDRFGAVLIDCDITMRNPVDEAFFCKGVGPLSVIDCRIHSEQPMYFGWTKYPPKWLRCYQSGVTLNGEDYTIGHLDSINTVDISHLPQLRAFRADDGNDVIYNTFNLLRGDDDWDPCGVRDLFERLGKMPTSIIMSTLTGRTPWLLEAAHDITLETGSEAKEFMAECFMHCGYPAGPTHQQLTWSAVGDGLKLEADGDRCIISGDNKGDEATECLLVARTPEGLEGCVAVTVLPSKVDPPQWIGAPQISVGKGEAQVDYALDLKGDRDESSVTWLRVCGNDTIAVSVSHGGMPKKTYRLTDADRGKQILAAVSAKSHRSDFGSTLTARCLISPEHETSTSDTIVDTDFSDFPTLPQPRIIRGAWTVDCYKPIDTQAYDWTPSPEKPAWEYGKGYNGAVGEGLLQCQRGARLLYTPLDDSQIPNQPHASESVSKRGAGPLGRVERADQGHDMEIWLDVDPTKTAGQGFGSATGQYMDVYINFDTRTLSGYALRIERTTKHSNAVDFSLVEYDKGIVKPISQPVSATCYRTGCHISLRSADGHLYADVTTDTPVKVTDPALASEVHLSAPIPDTRHCGFGIQHTGTCGENTTMLHRLKVVVK